MGAELDFRWRVRRRLALSGALAFTEFEFPNYPLGACHVGQDPDLVAGSALLRLGRQYQLHGAELVCDPEVGLLPFRRWRS